MASCAFCQIVAGDRDAFILYETDQTTAFLDSHPAVDGHTLVVPNTHQEFLFTSDQSMATAVCETVHSVVRAMDRALNPDGVSTFYTSARLVGNITHAHVHVVPRYDADDIQFSLARSRLNENDAAVLTSNIRDNL